jgi:uncharacterized membrane protein YfcA
LTSADLLLAAAMLAGAVLYSSVGHAGSSAYLAIMALFGIPPAVMRPTALVLNVLVASLTSTRYIRAGFFRWRVLWPFLAGSLPFAFLGGSLQLSGGFYKPLVGAVLLFAAARLLWPRALAGAEEPHDPPIIPALFIGAAVGLLSGLTGTGGGIFLSPVILFLGWSAPKTTSGVAAVFILCNSIAGLAGNLSSVQHLPAMLPLYAAAVLSGALVGTTLGIRFRNPGVLKALGLVEIVAGAKLFGLF